MRISESRIKQIINEEARRIFGEGDSIKGATFHKDPATGRWVTGGEDFPGEGGRAAMRAREPKILSVGNPDFLKRKFGGEGHEDRPGSHLRPGSGEAGARSRSVAYEPPESEWETDLFDDFGGGVEVGDPIEGESSDYDEDSNYPSDLDEARKKHKASAGTLAAFKKGAKGKKGGERKKRHAGFDAAKKSAEKWADEPAAVAQAATIKATGKPVVAKGEKRKIKESFGISESDLRKIIEEILES